MLFGPVAMESCKQRSGQGRGDRDAQAIVRQEHGSYKGIDWSTVQAKLEANPRKVEALHEMERAGGEPDVIGCDEGTDVSPTVIVHLKAPKGRRSTCYDRDALDAPKENKPSGNVIEMASSLGIEILTEAHYRKLQRLGEFDMKTSGASAAPYLRLLRSSYSPCSVAFKRGFSIDFHAVPTFLPRPISGRD